MSCARPALRTTALLGAAIVLALLAAPLPAAWAQATPQQAPLLIKDAEQEASIVADQLQQVGGATDLLVATGNVEITQGATRLLADRVEINRDTGEAVAQGKVVFFDGQDRLVGDRVDYNLKTGSGVVYNGSAFSAPFYHLSGERLDRVGEGVYHVRRGVFTTCEGDEPDWSFRMGSATADMNEGVWGTNGSFWVKNIPLIPYWPFFAAAIRRERQTGFLFPQYGNSSAKGLFASVPFFWAISDSQDLTVALDVFTKRGVGGEGEYRYIMSENARGLANGFLIQENFRDPNDRERLGIAETRGFGTLKHDWQITPRLSFKINANGTTDDLVYRDYGDRLAERSLQRAESNVFLTQRWDAWSLTGNVLWYQDLTTPVATELQRVPEIKLFGVRQPFPRLPGLLYEMESSFTNFYRVVGDSGARLDVHPRLFYPVPVAGLFTVTPFGGGRLTYYNQRATGVTTKDTVLVETSEYDPHVRRQLEGGFDVETRVSRVFQLGGWGGLEALQHVIEPRGTILVIRGLDQKANPQYDPAIDKIGKVTQFIYSVTTRLNAKTIGLPGADAIRWEAARLTVSQIFDIDLAAYQTEPFKDLFAELIIDPNRLFRFRADGSYNMYGLGLRTANLDLTAHYRDVALTAGWRYNTTTQANFAFGEASTRITNNFDVHASTSWDLSGTTVTTTRVGATAVQTNTATTTDNTAVEHRVGFDWRFQCFSISAEYIYRHKSESEFKFSINLLGVGQTGTRFGTGK